MGSTLSLRELLPGQTAADCPDLVARVFNMKLDALLTYLYFRTRADASSHGACTSRTCDIVRHARVLTRYEPHVEQVEWQKRGLPHAHILLILDEPIHPIGLMSMETWRRPRQTDSW